MKRNHTVLLAAFWLSATACGADATDGANDATGSSTVPGATVAPDLSASGVAPVNPAPADVTPTNSASGGVAPASSEPGEVNPGVGVSPQPSTPGGGGVNPGAVDSAVDPTGVDPNASNGGVTPVSPTVDNPVTPQPVAPVDSTVDPVATDQMTVAPTPADTGAVAPSMPSTPDSEITGTCAFTIDQQMSEKIPTVGILEWSVASGTVEEAHVEFGLDTNYGLAAPVDLAEPNLRTLLLGMKPAKEYNYRVVATVGGQTCASENRTLTTGGPTTSVPAPDITTDLPEQLSGGYLISARWGTNNGGPAFIMDADNEYVWWYALESDVIRTRMTYDGKRMWMRNTGQEQGTGVVWRVSMDGLEEERWELGMTTHDLAVMPDGRLGLTQWDGNGCAEILIFDPDDGSTNVIFNAKDAHGQSNCHVNNLQYYAEDDTFTFSDYQNDCFVKITSAGDLVWVLNGPASDFTGTNWEAQHGLHILSADHLMVFSNGGFGSDSVVYELQLDQAAKTADILWTYDSGISTPFGGDVQRLKNGNTVVTYSSSGEIHEVNAQGQLVQRMVWGAGTTVSYAMKRDDLYSSPPPKVWRFDDQP